MFKSLTAFASDQLAALEARRQRRRLASTDRHDSIHVRRGGRALVSFCCNDYLNLSAHGAVKAAAAVAIERFGAGAGASRLVTGDHPLLGELERALATFKDTEDAVVFGSGYLANLGIIPAVMGSGDLILVDELSHACILGGARLSGAQELRFHHNDMAHLETLLDQHRSSVRHALIVTDGVFSMDGDLAALPQIIELAQKFDAWVMTDDAHGLGTIGGGVGCSNAFTAPLQPELQMGTLSKALGSYGGYLCASQAVCELVRNRARTFVYSTGLPPASAAAALAALEIVRSDVALCAKPTAQAARFCEALGLPAPQSPIVPLVLGDEQSALHASAALEDAGFLVTAIRPPTVPAGTARLRFTFTAAHTDAEIDRLAGEVAKLHLSVAAE